MADHAHARGGWFRQHADDITRWLLHLLAVGALAMTLTATVLIWPFSYLGYDFSTDRIVFIAAGSPAAEAGLRLGDRIVTIYGRPWDEVVHQWSILPLLGPRSAPVVMTIERGGELRVVPIVRRPPSEAFQLGKGILVGLALLCWLTGYLLGLFRRREAVGLPVVALFWLLMSGVLGTYMFVRYASFPLQAVMRWFSLTMLVPLSVYVHVWFPIRPVTPETAQRARWILLASVVGLNLLLAGAVVVWRPSLQEAIYVMGGLLPAELLIGFVISGALLARAYRRVVIGHMRRQIRIIATACFVIAAVWLVLLVLPELAGGEPLIGDRWIDAVAGLLPLAYLVSGVMPNLYLVDRLAMRIGANVTAAIWLAVLFFVVAAIVPLRTTQLVLWMVLGAVALYRPAYQLALRIFPAHKELERSYTALVETAARLTTTLEFERLIAMLLTGVRKAFHDPPVAFFSPDHDDSELWRCWGQQHLPNLPTAFGVGVVTAHFVRPMGITDARTMHHSFATATLDGAEQELVHAPDIALWCPLYHSEGTLLGLLLIGPDRTLDPYRDRDTEELQRLMDAASLAFTNSAMYRQRGDAEALVRQLYESLQRAQDELTSAIAREIHDEVLNINVRENIQTIQELIAADHTPDLPQKLKELLESERMIGTILRRLCEVLYPTGMDDPHGLPQALRLQNARLRAQGKGVGHVSVVGDSCRIDPPQQREALRIAKEAVTNAIRHANATTITTTFVFPTADSANAELRVEDDGRAKQRIVPRAGHWGVRTMRESARLAGGELDIRPRPDGGTAVVFTFPIARTPTNEASEPVEETP